MNDKLVVISIYLTMGLIIALWPIWVREHFAFNFSINSLDRNLVKKKGIVATLIFSIFSIFLIWLTKESAAPLLLISFGLISILNSVGNKKLMPTHLTSIFFTLCVSATILWWHREERWIQINLVSILAFIIIVGPVSAIFSKKYSSDKKKDLTLLLSTFLFLSIAAALSFSTAILKNDDQLLTQWHHWSAYIAPAEQLLSGSIIFRDFPAQYGLGPTISIASFCQENCWYGMYFIVGFSTLIFGLLVYAISIALSSKHWSDLFIITALSLSTCFFWNAFPPNVGTPAVTPSVGGMRFLPVLVLISYLFFSGNIEASKVKVFFGHFLWLIGILWSPESAFYVTYVWGSYYIFIFRGTGSFFVRFKIFILNLIRLILIGIVFFAFFIFAFMLFYKSTPTLYGYLAYVLNPPGEMPINYRGGIWFTLFVVALSSIALISCWKKYGDCQFFRQSFLLQLLFFSVITYFLGRSHDNNLLNLMPFALLVLLSVRKISDEKILIKISSVLCISLLGWMFLFGWEGWKGAVSKQEGIVKFESKLLLNAASVSNFETGVKLSKRLSLDDFGRSYEDASRAISFIRSNYSEPITVLDFSMSLESASPQEVWSAFHNPANVYFISSENRRFFLKNSASTLRRTGWLIVNSKYPASEWLDDLDSAYYRMMTLEFGSYYAIRFQPKFD